MIIGVNLAITGTIVLNPPATEEPGDGFGPELVTNGDFSAGDTGWAIGNFSGTTEVSGGALHLHDPTDEGDTVEQLIATSFGTLYRVSCTVVSRTGGSFRFSLGGGPGAVINVVGPYQEDLFADGGGRMAIVPAVPNNIVIDDISVREVLA